MCSTASMQGPCPGEPRHKQPETLPVRPPQTPGPPSSISTYLTQSTTALGSSRCRQQIPRLARSRFWTRGSPSRATAGRSSAHGAGRARSQGRTGRQGCDPHTAGGRAQQRDGGRSAHGGQRGGSAQLRPATSGGSKQGTRQHLSVARLGEGVRFDSGNYSTRRPRLETIMAKRGESMFQKANTRHAIPSGFVPTPPTPSVPRRDAASHTWSWGRFQGKPAPEWKDLEKYLGS